MAYVLRTPDGKYERRLSEHEYKTILREALKHGWKPSARHLSGGKLRIADELTTEEAKLFAAALERGIPGMATISPPLVVAMLESISVLRRGGAQFQRIPDR